MNCRPPSLALVFCAAVLLPLLPAAMASDKSAAGSAAAEAVPNEKRVKAGAGHYHSYCARCHGLKLVSTNSSYYDLRRFPKDNKARFVKSVRNGKRAMPAWKHTLSDSQIEDLWHYVLSGG